MWPQLNVNHLGSGPREEKVAVTITTSSSSLILQRKVWALKAIPLRGIYPAFETIVTAIQYPFPSRSFSVLILYNNFIITSGEKITAALMVILFS
jgi:hypothetical protein